MKRPKFVDDHGQSESWREHLRKTTPGKKKHTHTHTHTHTHIRTYKITNLIFIL